MTDNNIFRDYYCNNKGKFYKSFAIKINTFQHIYDIYWGDPDVIFDRKSFNQGYPLAVTTIPTKLNDPNPRIFIHEKLESIYVNIFEMVIAHEIGHLWLHDIVGLTRPRSNNCMSEDEAEKWADYFSYKFFYKYRNINNLAEFFKILEEVSNFQIETYNLDPNKYIEYTYKLKCKYLLEMEERINFEFKRENETIIQIIKTIEITLESLGDIFKQ